MFTLDGIRRFHGWTHSCLNLLLDHVSTLPLDVYGKELPNFGFNTLRKQLIHIFNCEGFWIHTLQGLRYIDRDPSECPAVGDAKLLQRAVTDRTAEYLSGLTNVQLNTPAELRFPDGDAAIRTPSLVIHHFLTHAFHHKGQIVAMCRALGYPAPDTDLNQIEG